MKSWCALFMALLMLALVGCEAESPETIPAEPSTVPTEPAPPVEVSPLATEDFLVLEDASYPREAPPEFVMIHFTSAVMLDRENPYDYDLVRGIFLDNRLGIHYIIDRDGAIFCFLPESRAAWHAGKGSFRETKYTDKMNQYAIGIELMGIGSQEDMAIYLHPEEYAALGDDQKGFTDAQYEALAKLVRDICLRNSIHMDRQHIIGHQEYNPAKNDPGELFNWDGFMDLLAAE